MDDCDFRNVGHVGDEALFLLIVPAFHAKHDKRGLEGALSIIAYYDKRKYVDLLCK